MSTEHMITRKAADGSLTITELREFLDEFDKAVGPAHELAGSDGSVVVIGRHNLRPKVRSGFKGEIKSITVTIPGEDEKR